MAVRLTPDDVLRAGMAWALWKVLDHVSARFVPGAAGLSGSAARNPETALSAGLAALGSVDPSEVQSALASLSDDESPLVQALAWALGAEGIDAAERQRRLEASLAVLTRGEAFALLAVLLYQGRQAG